MQQLTYRHILLSGACIGCAAGALMLILVSRSFAASAPVVNSVTAAATQGGIESTLSLTENNTATLYVYGSITDADGCEDVATNGTVTGKFYRSNHASGDGCSADNNDCYTIANAACTKTNCTGPEDTTLDYQCTASIQYYADATTSGPNSGTDWTAKITATDAASTTGTNTDTIEVASMVALDVTPSIQYGSIDLGAESSQQTATVTNTGNNDLDVTLSVNGAMTCASGSISANSAHYSDTAAFSYNDGSALSTTPTELELNLPHLTSDGGAQTKNIYLKLKMPASGAGGSCSNTLSVSATADTENGW